MLPNRNVFELTTATELQEKLDEIVVQLKDQDDDLHEVVNGDAGDKEEDFATNSEIFTVSANSEMVINVSNESEDKDYETEEGHPVDRVEQRFATASQKILTFSANADIFESVTIRDVEAVIFRPHPIPLPHLSLPLPPTKNEKTTVDNFLNFCGSVACLLLHFIILRGQKSSFIAISSPTSLELIVQNYSVFLLFRY